MLGRRVLALSIDGMFLLTVLIVAGTALASFELTFYVFRQNFPFALVGFATLPLVQYLVVYPVGLLYFTLLEGRYGKSPGKEIAGIKVVTAAGKEEIDYRTAFVRRLLDLLDCLPVLWTVAGILILSDRDNRRLGDRVAGTEVVRDHGKETYGSLVP